MYFSFPTINFFRFLKSCGAIIGVLFLTIQCSWTPEVQTPIHNSQTGIVFLQTSEAFKARPQHPQDLSPTLIKQILKGLSHREEHGLLQELFISNPKITPVFSTGQIEFLTPYLVEAFRKVTSEELIGFQLAEEETNGHNLSGTMSLFSPSTFFFTIQHRGDTSGIPSKASVSTRNLRHQTTLTFSDKHASLSFEEASRFIKGSFQRFMDFH